MTRFHGPPTLLCGLLAVCTLTACEEREFANVYKIERMSQTIGGPAAMARPGDLLLENDRLRAVIHGRHNMRSTSPVTNGSLIDLDIRRPLVGSRVGAGKDAFYELGPMVNLKISSAEKIEYGPCEEVRERMGSSPCSSSSCVRVSTEGRGENMIALMGLLDLVISRAYGSEDLTILTDWDVCPGEPVVRVTTSVRVGKKRGTPAQMTQYKKRTDMVPALLGRGLLAGDLTFFSGKMNVFIPDYGFDHDGYIRSVFSTPDGNSFSAPMAKAFVAGIGDGVSYAYFNKGGVAQVPVFTEAFTAAMTDHFECSKTDTKCLDGKEPSFSRYVSVGHGDIASALEGYYEINRIATGRVEGHVVSRRSRTPLSGVHVFAFAVPSSWNHFPDKQLATRLNTEGVAGLMAQSRAASGDKVDPFGHPGIVSHFITDVGLDAVKDGSFSGSLPATGASCDEVRCRYVLATYGAGRAPSRPVLIAVQKNRTTKPVVVVGDTARLEYRITDHAGRSLPSKITIGHCFAECATDRDCPAERPLCDMTSALVSDKRGLCIPKQGYSAGSCRPDQSWGTDPVTGKQTCICHETGRLPVSLGGSRYADGVVHIVRSHTGHGELSLEPGVYQVLASRGFEYNIKRQFVTLTAGGKARLLTALSRVVDTRGWISADFHVHGPNSPDASALFEPRVQSFVAEGVELLSSSDHDQLTDYRPTIYKMGMRPWLKSQIGLETSPIDYGHFLGFPLKFNEKESLNGAFHWKVPLASGDKPPPKSPNQDWRSLRPSEIFAKMRAMGSLGEDKTVTMVAHFYDYFNYYYLDPWGEMAPGKTIMAMLWDALLTQVSPVLNHFSGEFDALEGFNGKSLDIIRRPTYREIMRYNTDLQQLLAQTADVKKWSFRRQQRALGLLSAGAQREVLRRTADEQSVSLDFAFDRFDPGCTTHSNCKDGYCDPVTGACATTTCKEDKDCDAKLVAAGREKCLPAGQDKPKVLYCQRVEKECTSDADCAHSWGSGTTKEKCAAQLASAPSKKSCVLTCKSDSECKTLDARRPVCNLASASCVSPGIYPVNDLRGSVDDWFQMLNRGVRRTFIGNSDTHGMYDVEAGLPRNYVKSSTDVPTAISSEEVAVAVKAGQTFATYGPFVEVTVNGEGLGQKVIVNCLEKPPKKCQVAKDAVKLKLRVQSPLWFDVDRLEIYRNGTLIKVIKGSPDCAKGSPDCIQSPNKQVVNYEGTISDTPDADAWYVVIALGLDGKTLAPVYSSSPVARLGMYELMQKLVPLVPIAASFSSPLPPSMTIARPYALTNPIWVDVGGDGLTALRPFPRWATSADKAAFRAPSGGSSSTTSSPASSSLKTAPGPKTHSHDHANGLGRMRNEARYVSGMQRGKVSAAALRRALEALRYMH